MTLARNGVVVSRDRAELAREVRAIYGDDTAREVTVASLPPDEQWRILEHRRRQQRRAGGEDSERGR